MHEGHGEFDFNQIIPCKPEQINLSDVGGFRSMRLFLCYLSPEIINNTHCSLRPRILQPVLGYLG